MLELHGRISASEIIGLKTLIVGDVGTGKTRLTARLLDELVDLGLKDHITVIDLGPERRGVGLKLTHFSGRIGEVRLLVPEFLNAPRLEGDTAGHVERLAWENARRIDAVFQEFLDLPTPILIVNDLSMYLQAGSVEKVFLLIEKSSTFLANSYLGQRLSEDHGSGVSIREREAVLKIIGKMDRVIHL